jgi:hypothetical protein
MQSQYNMATYGLPFSRKEKTKGLAEAKPLIFLVARGGIEPPTQGFSILCSHAQIISYQTQIKKPHKAAFRKYLILLVGARGSIRTSDPMPKR